MTRQERRIEAARRRVVRAQAQLERAGEAFLVAIGATDEERDDAADCILDCFMDENSEGFAPNEGPRWAADMAEQVLLSRDWAAEVTAEEAAKAARLEQALAEAVRP